MNGVIRLKLLDDILDIVPQTKYSDTISVYLTYGIKYDNLFFNNQNTMSDEYMKRRKYQYDKTLIYAQRNIVDNDYKDYMV